MTPPPKNWCTLFWEIIDPGSMANWSQVILHQLLSQCLRVSSATGLVIPQRILTLSAQTLCVMGNARKPEKTEKCLVHWNYEKYMARSSRLILCLDFFKYPFRLLKMFTIANHAYDFEHSFGITIIGLLTTFIFEKIF